MATRSLTALGYLLITIAVFGQQTTSFQPAPDKDPFVGRWQANRDKSEPRLGKEDASYVRVIA